MTEYISREAAIDDLTHTLFYDQRDKATAKKVIATLLTADVKPVVRGMTVGTVDEHILGCIDRFAASEVALRRLERARHLMEDGDDNGGVKELVGGYSEIIELPAADVKPVVRGEWQQTGDYSAVCTACGKTTLVGGVDRTGQALIHKGLFHFCPNCGADMRGDTHDQ